MAENEMVSQKQSLISTPSTNRKEATEAIFRIKDCYPNSGGQSREYFLNLIGAAETFPVEVIKQLADLRYGLPARLKFIPTVADVVQFCEELTKPHVNPFEMPRSYNPGPNFTGCGSSEPDSPEVLARRKAFVIGILGYDPAERRREQACFIPPAPSVDVSDFPDAPGNTWKPSPAAIAASLEASSAGKPWHDKEELRKSAERIARESKLMEY